MTATLRTIRVSEVYEKLKSGYTRWEKDETEGVSSIQREYGLSFSEMKILFSHPRLKGIKTRPQTLQIIDDLTPAPEPAPAPPVEEPPMAAAPRIRRRRTSREPQPITVLTAEDMLTAQAVDAGQQVVDTLVNETTQQASSDNTALLAAQILSNELSQNLAATFRRGALLTAGQMSASTTVDGPEGSIVQYVQVDTAEQAIEAMEALGENPAYVAVGQPITPQDYSNTVERVARDLQEVSEAVLPGGDVPIAAPEVRNPFENLFD